MGITVHSFASYVPPKRVDNKTISENIDSSDEWIYSHTGIRYRHISQGETTSTLGLKAAENALQKAGISAEQVGLIVVATTTPDYTNFPSTASIIQKKLGIKDCCSYDISAACTGFVYAFMNAVQWLEYASSAKYALIIGSEVFSKIVDWTDRATCILFGDGAGAALLSKSSTQSQIVSSTLGCLPDEYASLTAHAEPKPHIFMDGRKVYNFAIQIIPDVVNKLLADVSLKTEDIAYVVAHQANTRILQSAAKRLTIPIEKFFMNLEEYANTSSASIPIALAEMQEKNLLKKDQYIILVGFGAGLTYGGILLQW